ncbi:MAG: stage III sporulation protein AB [Vallitaleaceae bacterium]|nr:stage III sporulation protein AB [Vallitaleaceae bacterium]
MKYIGMVMVFVACSGLGIMYSVIYKKRVEELIEWKKGIVLLKSEINFALTPLSEAFESIGNRLNGEIKTFFIDLSSFLKSSPHKSMDKMVDQDLRNMLNETCLNDKDAGKIVSFVKGLGLMNKESQMNQLELHIKTMEADIETAKNEEEKNSKLYKTLGVLCGVFIVVLLF